MAAVAEHERCVVVVCALVDAAAIVTELDGALVPALGAETQLVLGVLGVFAAVVVAFPAQSQFHLDVVVAAVAETYLLLVSKTKYCSL